MLSNDNAFLNTYTSKMDAKCKANPFDQRTLFARFKTQAARTSGINDLHPIILLRHAVFFSCLPITCFRFHNIFTGSKGSSVFIPKPIYNLMALLSLQGDTQLSETISKVINFFPEIFYVIQRYLVLISLQCVTSWVYLS